MGRQADVPRLKDGTITLSINELRWMSMAAGDFSRDLAIWEVREFGLDHACETSRRFDERRQAFARLLETKQS
jgi:hypothetical protein